MEDFSIQFSEEVRSVCQRRWKSYQNARPGKLHPLTRDTDNFIFPRKFRELRALAIACWYLPDWLKWEIILYLNDLVYSIDFEHNGLVQSTELRVLVSSEEDSKKFVQSYYNPRELFGTILQEDLKNALLSLEHKEQSDVVRKPIRRKGYRDKGTWRPPHRWQEKHDYSFRDEQMLIEKKRLLITLFTLIYRYKLKS
jgi:hypothetical protein